MEMYLSVVAYHKYKMEKHIHIDMFNIAAKIDDVYVVQSWNTEST